MVLGFIGTRLPWLWCLLLSLPLVAWFLRREQRTLQSMIIVFLDEIAKEWKLTKARPSPAPPAIGTSRLRDIEAKPVLTE